MEQVPYGYVRMGSNVFFVTRPLVDVESAPLYARAAVYPNALDDGGWTSKQQSLLDSVQNQPSPPATAPVPITASAPPRAARRAGRAQYTPDPLDRFDADAASSARNAYDYDLYGGGSAGQQALRPLLVVSD